MKTIKQIANVGRTQIASIETCVESSIRAELLRIVILLSMLAMLAPIGLLVARLVLSVQHAHRLACPVLFRREGLGLRVGSLWYVPAQRLIFLSADFLFQAPAVA